MTKLHVESSNNIDLKAKSPAKSLEELQSEASIQLKKILEQKKAIKKFQSNMDILMKRYHVDESLFGQVALWYGNLSWWVKLGHLTVISSIFAVSIILGAVILVLYSAFALLFTDYYNVSEKRDKRFCADIIELEKSLAESVEHISKIEDDLKAVFTSLCEMNIEQANDIAVFKIQIKELEKQIQLLNEITSKISQTKDSLIDSTARIAKSLEKSALNFNELNDSLSSESGDLKQTDMDLSQTVGLIIEDHELLNKMNIKFDESNTHLSILAENLAQLLLQLKDKVDLYENNHESLCPAIPVLISRGVEIKKIIEHADETVDDAFKLLEEYKREQELGQTNTSPGFMEEGHFTSNTASLLARAKKAVSSAQTKPCNQNLAGYAFLLQ